MWADPLLGRPEAALTGVTFTRGGYHRVHGSVPAGTAAYEVHHPEHWLLEGTGLRRGDLLGAAVGVVGYECDGCELTMTDGLPVATGKGGTPAGFEVVATAPAIPSDALTTPLPIPDGGRYELEFHAERLLGDDSPANRAQFRNGHAVLGCTNEGARSSRLGAPTGRTASTTPPSRPSLTTSSIGLRRDSRASAGRRHLSLEIGGICGGLLMAWRSADLSAVRTASAPRSCRRCR